MSIKTPELTNEKDVKKTLMSQNIASIFKRNVNTLINPRTKTTYLNYRRNRIKINTRENDLIERKSYNNELLDNENKNIEANSNENKENNPIENKENSSIENKEIISSKNKENNPNENYSKINKKKTNNNTDNSENEKEKSSFEENESDEKSPNALEIGDLIGEKCSIDLDILSINFNNYESSKTSSKKMGLIHAYGANTYQGLVRNYNEDRVSIIINMARPKTYTKKYWPKTSFFGIYDGHGGSQCSEYLRDSLHKLILNDPNYPENVEMAIKNGFKNAEENFLNNYALDPNDKNNILDKSGSCAVITLFVDDKIYVANVGDSRALFSEDNGTNYVEITEDHKPNNPKEKKRIIRNGGHVYQSQTVINGTEKESLNGQILLGPYRVLPGRLSVSRTIGDIEAKNEKFGGNPNVIICDPDIFTFDLKRDKIDFFIMGCDGIYDQMNNDEIIDCAWMILNNKKKSEENEEDNDNNNEENEEEEYNFENYNIHEKCGLIVDFIIKSAMVRKSFDNVTCLMIALSDFTNKEEEIKIEKNNLYTNTLTQPKKYNNLLNKRKYDTIKAKEEKEKISDNKIVSNNTDLNDLTKDLPLTKAKGNIRLTNYIRSRDNNPNNDNNQKVYKNTDIKLKNKNSFTTNTNENANTSNTSTNTKNNINMLANNKIYIKKRKERNLPKKKTNQTEITMYPDGNTSNRIMKKILNKSEIQDERKPEIENENDIENEIDNEKSKTVTNKDNFNVSQSHNDISNNYSSPIKSTNNSISYNSNNLSYKLRHNKINKIPFQLNNKVINNANKNNINNINIHFHYSNTNSNNNYKNLPNMKTNSINNISNLNQNFSRTSSTSVENNHLNFHLKPKKLKNFTKPKTFRYNSNNGLYPYRDINKTNNFTINRIHYNSNTHNTNDYNSNTYLHPSRNLEIKSNNNSGSISSRKKKFSYNRIIKKLSSNTENSKNKNNQLSNKKLSYSKEKDIHNFLYRNKTNIKASPNEDINKRLISNKLSKLTMKNGRKKIKI